ncbi:MAG: tetratricopeptide repeat protein, partial [Deltaproteobacteria bacterium]|nr:tetratricopeptide repeat protein [Deltaproteobacteria bacterium]
MGPTHPGVATGLNNLAALYQAQGDYGRAELLYRRALAIDEKGLGPMHPDMATDLNNLATLYKAQGDYMRAEPLYRRALAITEKSLGPTHHYVASTKRNIGGLYLVQGQLAAAYEIFKGEKGSAGLGLYYLLTSDYQAAQEQFNEILEHFKKTRESDPLLTAYIGLGFALEGLRRHKAAAEAYQQAVTLMEEQRATLAPAARTHFLEGEVGESFKRILAYEGLIRVSAALQDPAASVFWAESTKARLLLEAMGSRASAKQLGLPDDLARQETEMSTRITATYKQMEIVVGQKNANQQQEVEQELATLKQEQATLVARLRREYPAYAAIRYPQPLRVGDLKLKPEEVLIEYEVTETATFAWLLRGKEVVKTFTIPITRKALTEQVKKYRGFFEEIADCEYISRCDALVKFDPQIGKALYDLLFKDFVPLLKEGDQIIIVPDEILGVLPFETLVAEPPAKVETATGKYGPYPQGVKYLGNVYPISYYQSATVLTLTRTLKGAEASKNKKILVVADPVFDLADARLGGKHEQLAKSDAYQGLRRAVADYRKGGREGAPLFPRLENTGQLPESLKLSYGTGIDALSGLAASEPELRKRPLKDYGSLIFATHGILDDQVPYIQEPALVLSQVGVNMQEPDQDGFLTMSEVMGLKLNAEVAALTACNTGMGKNLTGEGV